MFTAEELLAKSPEFLVEIRTTYINLLKQIAEGIFDFRSNVGCRTVSRASRIEGIATSIDKEEVTWRLILVENILVLKALLEPSQAVTSELPSTVPRTTFFVFFPSQGSTMDSISQHRNFFSTTSGYEHHRRNSSGTQRELLLRSST